MRRKRTVPKLEGRALSRPHEASDEHITKTWFQPSALVFLLAVVTVGAAEPAPVGGSIATDSFAREIEQLMRDEQQFHEAVLRSLSTVVTADLAGVDALTGGEVPDTAEMTKGVLVCASDVDPRARLIVKSCGQAGFRRTLSFKERAKVKVYKGGVLITGDDDGVIEVPGDNKETYEVVRDPTWKDLGETVIATLSVEYQPAGAVDSDEVKLVILKVDLDDSDLWFFRNEDYELPLTITPSSASDLVNVSVSGFDDIHWTAAYNAPFKKIDFSNLILESELVGWLDEQELSISAGVGCAADSWSWTKKLKLKKRLDGLWDDVKQDAIDKVNDLVSPADEIKTLVQDNLTDVSAIDSGGLVHTIPPGAINSAANFAYASISTWWADFVGSYIWSDVPVSELHEKVTKESWTWDWNVDAEINFSGGSISLDPGFSDAVQWIESISDTGFSSETFVFENAMISTSVTADGETANADVEAVMNAFLRYANETVIDIETGETAEGRIEYGIGISLHIRF